jgi:hypothetical protein
MPKVGSSNEALLERALFGFDGTLWRPVKLDTSGNLVFTPLAGSSMEVTQDTAADLKATVSVAAGQSIQVTQATAASLKATVDIAADQVVKARLSTYDGAAWRKQSVIPAVEDTVSGLVGSSDLPAGTSTLNGTAVAAGKVWVITHLAMYYTGTITNVQIYTWLRIDGVSYDVFTIKAPVSALVYDRQGYWVLGASDYVQAYVSGATLHNSFFVEYTGFLFTVNNAE